MANTDYVVRLNGEDNLSSSVNKAKQSLQDFERVGQTAMQKIDAKFQRIITSSAPLKRQLRDLQQLMADMNFKGLSNTEEFTRIAQTAGQIKDAISDAAAATQRFANDTMTLQAGIQALQGIAGAASAVQGAMALLGTENEDVARSIQKVQGALAILNGVQALANSLNKDSILMQKLKQIRLAATTATTTTNTVATTANTVATTANTAATSASVIVQKVWNVTKAIGKALLGDFSGLLIVGAAALATYAIVTSNSKDKQKELNNETEKAKSIHQMVYDARSKTIDSIADEINKINALRNIIHSANASYQEKINAYNQLRQIVPQYNATISQEGAVQYEAVNAIYAHIAALKDLQRAMALLEVGKEIEKEQLQAELDLQTQQDKLRRKQINAIYDRAEMARTSKQSGPTWQGGRSNEYLAAQNRLQINTNEINKTNKAIAEQTTKIKELTDKRRAYDKLVEKEKPQDIIAAVNGKQQKPTTPKATRGGGGKATPQVDKAAEEQTNYDKNKATLQQQYNDKLIDELTYRSKALELEKQHYNYLLSSDKATKQQIENAQKLYEAAQSSFKSFEIEVNFKSNITDLNAQLADGLITVEQYAESVANAYKTVYLENQKIGEATKEMAEDYIKAAKEAELYKEAATLDENIKNAKYEPQTSSFEQATQGDKQKTWDEQLDAIQNQMDFNDELIVQLQELLNIYQQLGLVGTDSYNAINDKLNETIQANQELGASAVEVSQKQEEWLRKQEMIQGWSDSLSELGGIFSSLSGAVDETTGAWLQFTGQALEGAAKIIPLIQKLVLAKQAEAIASGTAEGAKMPFPANIAAILSIIGVIASVFASMPKFASGGIVGGASRYGDNILARVNSGEMILNASQQSNLWNAIENGELNTLNRFYVDWRLRGADLYGSLKNYGKTQNKTGKGISL